MNYSESTSPMCMCPPLSYRVPASAFYPFSIHYPKNKISTKILKQKEKLQNKIIKKEKKRKKREAWSLAASLFFTSGCFALLLPLIPPKSLGHK